MKNVSSLAAIATTLLLAGCSGLQAKRDLKHAADAEQYIDTVRTASASFTVDQCHPVKLGTWTNFVFSSSSPAAKLPNGIAASAFCFTKPSGAKILKVRTYATGGFTFHELTVVYPSVLSLDKEFKIVTDLQNPRLSPSDHYFKGLGLNGNIVLIGEAARTEHVVFYVHPLSLKGAISVQTNFESIPVPYGPYGEVEIRFE